MASSRPKGYMEWNPSAEVLHIVSLSKQILREYGSYGPMTVRQIFYRLVGEHGYDKTERAYKRLAEYLVKARRSQMISFDAIRDDGGTTRGGPWGFDSVDDFLEDLAAYSTQYALNPTLEQPHHIMIYCEAEGMVPMLSQMVRDYGVAVTGTGGFSSLTVTHHLAVEVDGVQFEYGVEGAFFIPRRVALTEEQVEEYDLPSAPPKSTDSRSANWSGLAATQAEAMDPDTLNDVVNTAVSEWVDEDKLAEIRERSETERELIGDRVKDAVDAIRNELKDES
jgi:hypothetical protein